MRIHFRARSIVVKQVQRALGLPPDGDDRRLTWQRIVEALPLQPVPQIPVSKAVDFPSRHLITLRVQRALGAYPDGHDGQETWSMLAQRFDPALVHSAAASKPPALTDGSQNYPERWRGQTPNCNPGVNDRRGVILHHASGYFEGTVAWCLQKGTHAGYHVLINLDGERAVLARDTDCAHHAGDSTWRGRKLCNYFMLGIAFVGNTNDGTMRGSAGPRLTRHEIASAMEWLTPRMAKYRWTAEDITTHHLVAPRRKDDTSLNALQAIRAALA